VVVSLYHSPFAGTRHAHHRAQFLRVARVRDLPPPTACRTPRTLNGTIVHGIENPRSRPHRAATTYRTRFRRRHGPARGASPGSLQLGCGASAPSAGQLRPRRDHLPSTKSIRCVTRIAQTQFASCANPKAAIRIVPGDARLSLEGHRSKFRHLLVDASPRRHSHSPVTVEAFQLYLRQLQPNACSAMSPISISISRLSECRGPRAQPEQRLGGQRRR